ncbi:tyrosine-type recombinase/integrase [Streptomyces sp. NBC_01728]|nr:tyrosine-type recombinase/integrase [Streptomyces sp. NBC_01719]MCX4461024.1 tyrosine-type recombinase/integrase [Streptomyces sp. NBC_01719]MCX4499647.1 tyrosine-type recombinase/integrase [Streptomyces sp. NBC_01728]
MPLPTSSASTCPRLPSDALPWPARTSPRTLRHTAAMALLTAGVDTSTIALWLGHASTKATDIYLHADLAMKERALARTAPRDTATKRYRPTDSLLTFLENL